MPDTPESLASRDGLAVYRIALLTRAIDRRLWELSRMGLAHFVLTGRGHEVAQIATARALRAGHDSAWPYYRDLAVGIALGVTPYELFLGALGRGDDPHTGARQMTAHLSSPRLGIGSVSSAIAAHIPHAVGAAYGYWVRGEDRVAACWFGEGATSEGATHEAMNLASARRLPVVFFCENNGWAISVPQHLQMGIASVADRAVAYGIAGVSVDGTDAEAVGRLARAAVERARGGGGPSLIELVVPRMTPHSSQDDDTYRTDEERRAAAARDPLPRLRQSLIAAGLLTESDDERLTAEASSLVEADAERAVAAPQPDGARARRWLFAGDPPHASLDRLERSAAQQPRSSPPRLSTAEPAAGTREVRMIDAIRDVIREEMRADGRVVVLGQDVGRKGGVFKATQGLLEEFGSKRVLDTPISEIVIAGAAIGAAMTGLRPIAEFQFSDYMHPAFDQIVNQAATLRWRSVGGWGAPVVFRAPIGAVEGGGVYHSQSVEALYCHVPGVKVVVPATPRDAKGLLRAAIRDEDPVVFFEHKMLYRGELQSIPAGEVIPLGVARLDRPGSTLSIVTYGIGVHLARRVALELAGDGIDVEILDLRTLIPFDKDAVAATVRKTSRVLILHEANRTMGFGAELAAFVGEDLFESLDAPICRVGAADCHVAYNTAEAAAIIPSAESVCVAARRLAAY